MLHFECDYNNGCHPKILERLAATNNMRTSGYGFDEFTDSAKEKIRAATGCPNADIYLLGGGSQTNSTVIAAMLKPYQGVVAASTGHIAGHEAGAVEFTGHKVIALPGKDGKLDASTLRDYLITYHGDETKDHVVFPGMVYISFPTELGTIYTKQDLTDIRAVCDAYGIPLFIDGARLGYGLMSRECDLTLPEFAALCDVFYIGGTKVGALCGEAVVFPKGNVPDHFFSIVKQHGALFAKGRLCGIQFETLFTDNLYFEISKNAIETAELLKTALKEKNYPFFLETPTNQQFVIVRDDKVNELNKSMASCFWSKYDETHTVIRFCTGWATTREEIEALKQIL